MAAAAGAAATPGEWRMNRAFPGPGPRALILCVERWIALSPVKKQSETETSARGTQSAPARNTSRDVISHVTIRVPICHFL